MTNVGRPRQFDEGEALQRITEAFWASGYRAASFEQLVEASGLSRSSLYNAFGDKEQMFEKALGHYLRTEVHDYVTRLEKPAGAGGMSLETLIEGWRGTCSPDGRGCLFAKLLLENAAEAGTKPRQGCVVTDMLARMWRGLASLVSRSGRRKTQRPLTDNEAGALLLTLQLGLHVLAKNGTNDQIVAAVIEGARKVVDAR